MIMDQDVVSPELIWIEGKCFRVNDVHNVHRRVDDSYSDSENEANSDNGDEYETMEDVELTVENGVTKASFHVATAYFGQVIGNKGSVLKRLTNETGADIKLPKRGQQGNVIVVGAMKQNVLKAVSRINMIVIAARQKQRLTHFLSIRMGSPEIVENYLKFMKQVLEEPAQGVTSDLFLAPAKLHLTLTLLSLMDRVERERAESIMNEAKSKIIDPLFKNESLRVSLKGVSRFNDEDPKATHVLFTEVTETNDRDRGVLLRLAEELESHFSRCGFSSRKNSIRLHVTLMNTSYRTRDDSSARRVPFDASRILETYGGYYFGECQVRRVHLSQMHSTGDDGYYASTFTLDICQSRSGE